MFRTDFNHLLQSINSSFFSHLMIGVSELGMTLVILLVVIFVTSTLNFRKGIILMNIVGWMALATVGLKAYFDYPRPYAVDPTLKTFGAEKVTDSDLTTLQPRGFLDGFSDPLLVKIRSRDVGRNGFPSGHVILISGLWIGLALLFRKNWLWCFSLSLVFLTMFSRLYLGVHYLGDVLGGLATALLLLLIFNYSNKKGRLETSQEVDLALIIFLLAPIILIFLTSFLPVPGFQAGTLIGLNLAYLLIVIRQGHPILTLGFRNRFLSFTVYFILYLAMYYGLKLLHLPKYGLWPVLIYALANLFVLIGIYLFGRKLKVYTTSV